MKKVIITLIILQFPFVIANAQWILQQSGVTSALRDIEFINSNTGWICGSEGIILKTTNGGLNWIQQINEASGKSLTGIHPVNENLIYCVGYFETILKTTNGGINWTTIQNGPIGLGRSYLSVFFLNEMTGWIGSTNSVFAKVMKTTNGGINWEDYIHEVGWLYDIYFKDSLNGIGVSSSSCYGLTSNGGVNWTLYQVGNGDYYDISIMSYNKNIGFIVSGIGYSVRKTTNFGVTFDSVGNIPFVVPPYEIYCSKFINENVGWAGGSYGVLYKTGDGGKTWHQQNSLNQAFVRRIYALNDTVVWAVGGGGKIIHTTNGGDTITSIYKVSNTIPIEIKLFQNYPNPFNPISKIKYEISKLMDVKLIVFDILGKEVVTLVNEKHQPGKYEATFDGNNLPSGIYFYRLENENNFITKKMILIK